MKLTPRRPPTMAKTSVTTSASSDTRSPCLRPERAAMRPAAYPPMRKANRRVIKSPTRAVVPPSAMPCRPAVPKIAPTMPLTRPLRIRPAPSAASHPSTTLTQLVPLSASEDGTYPEPRLDSWSLRPSSTLRGPDPPRSSARTSFSSTLGALVFPCLSLIRSLLSDNSVGLLVPLLLGGAFGLGHEAVVEQCAQHTPYDRPQDVEPRAREVPRHQHRAQSSRRVHSAPRHGSRDEDPHRQGKTHRYGSYRGRSPLVGGHRHHHKHQDEGDQDLNEERLKIPHPLRGVGRSQLCLAPGTRSAEGQPRGQG